MEPVKGKLYRTSKWRHAALWPTAACHEYSICEVRQVAIVMFIEYVPGTPRDRGFSPGIQVSVFAKVIMGDTVGFLCDPEFKELKNDDETSD